MRKLMTCLALLLALTLLGPPAAIAADTGAPCTPTLVAQVDGATATYTPAITLYGYGAGHPAAIQAMAGPKKMKQTITAIPAIDNGMPANTATGTVETHKGKFLDTGTGTAPPTKTAHLKTDAGPAGTIITVTTDQLRR